VPCHLAQVFHILEKFMFVLFIRKKKAPLQVPDTREKREKRKQKRAGRNCSVLL